MSRFALPGWDANGVDPGGNGSGWNGRVDWQASPSQGWGPALSPYAPPSAPKSGTANFAEFLMKITKGQPEPQSAGFDEMGRELLGKEKAIAGK